MSTSSFQELRERLAMFGFEPSKRFGQNFLVDAKLLAAIAAAAPLEEDALVLEIGAGPGALTRALAERGARVLACEIDKRLCAFLRSEMPLWGDAAERVRLLPGDALDHGELADAVLDALEQEGVAERGFVCASNLPYAIAGPALAALVGAPHPPRAILALGQLEMVERVLAAPGSKQYGTLSVAAQLGYHGRLLRKVPPEVFRPRPRVDSGLLLLDAPKPWLELPAAERRACTRLLQQLFASRRKMLRQFVKRRANEDPLEWMARHELPEDWLSERPEALAPDKLWALLRPLL
jgi:16S rRNA (adenine1518-N6/adenine1519-N6)-dimethyltransferase